MRLLLDVTRLCQRSGHTTPSGIDRVQYAYFAHAMAQANLYDPQFVVFWRFLEGVVRTERVRSLRALVDQAWNMAGRAGDDASYQTLKQALELPLDSNAAKPFRSVAPGAAGSSVGRFLFNPRDMLRARARLARRMRPVSGVNPVYLHTSHSQLDKIGIPRWLTSHAVAPVFFLHDVIPIDYPEFCRPGERERHIARLQVMSEHAHLILVNSQATADAARRQLLQRNWRVPAFAVAPLGVEACFRDTKDLDPPQARHPYALVVGTIEPRKNLAFLLAIWRRLVETHGDRAPRLVVVGRRGWENENVIDYFERSTALAPFLFEASDISDAGLASLMAGASVVLSPSMAEGFNLPIAEALSLGRPVIASDIPVHREIASGFATFVDPHDGPGWVRAIEDACLGGGDPTRSTKPLHGSDPYPSLTWSQHVELGLALISSLLEEFGGRDAVGATGGGRGL